MCLRSIFSMFVIYSDSGEAQVTISDEKGVNVPVKMVDNKDKTYRVEFQATTVGNYTANVSFANQAIPTSPHKITVLSGTDVTKVTVKDLPES